MLFRRIVAALLLAALVVPFLGCGSDSKKKEEDKQPKLQGPGDPKIKGPATPGGGAGNATLPGS